MDTYTFGNGYSTNDLRAQYNNARPGTPNGYYPRDLSAIKGIIVHHGAFAYTDPLEAIQREAGYHMNGQGWPGIGYHFCIGPEGESYYVGDILTLRYHATEAGNPWAIGVEMLGDFSTDRPTLQQMMGLVDLLGNLQFALGSRLVVEPHRAVVQTSCPGGGLVAAVQAHRALCDSLQGWG